MEKCFMCGKMSTIYNSQGIPMCRAHNAYEAANLKCPTCRGELDVLAGKYGKFLNCFRCGNISFYKLKQVGNIYFIKKK
jgi:ssDNA-binding Zn-finger/Zn-ribbon topoisomerase 1